MKAETFLANLNERYRAGGGASLDLLALHIAEALEEVSEAADPLEELTNDQLREILEKRDLPTSGNKAELLARIRETPTADEIFS